MRSASASASPTATGTDRPGGEGGPIGRWRRRLAAPVDAAGLAAFRIVFGSLLLVAVVRYAAKGMIGQAFVEQTVYFPLWSWLRPLPPPGMHLLFVLLGVLAACLTVGLFTRASAALFCLLFSYAHFSDLTHYLNHYYLVTLLTGLLAVMPSGRIWSVDDRLRRRSGQAAPATVPAWTLGLFRFQIACVYFFAGVAKWRSDWLVHGLPLRIWLPTNGDHPLLGRLLMRPETAHLASWGAAAFDTFVPFLLLWRRTRPFALVAAAVFHLLTVRLFRLGMFPFFMIGCSLLFLPPGWPRRLLGRPSPPQPAPAPPARPLGRPACLALLAYAGFQVLFPLRQHLYSGNVLWSERGYRFAWHVMLMEKTGVADFTVRDRRTGKERPVRLRDQLTPLQIKMMATQPDLLRSFARTLARQEGPEVTVHADVLVSLNGRPLRPLIDPRVDLAAEHLPATWILPLPDAAPP
jgi:vitamin K-dependent gamma-carboxylase